MNSNFRKPEKKTLFSTLRVVSSIRVFFANGFCHTHNTIPYTEYITLSLSARIFERKEECPTKGCQEEEAWESGLERGLTGFIPGSGTGIFSFQTSHLCWDLLAIRLA